MGGETKILGEGQTELRGGCLKRGRAGIPSRTMSCSQIIYHDFKLGTSVCFVFVNF